MPGQVWLVIVEEGRYKLLWVPTVIYSFSCLRMWDLVGFSIKTWPKTQMQKFRDNFSHLCINLTNFNMCIMLDNVRKLNARQNVIFEICSMRSKLNFIWLCTYIDSSQVAYFLQHCEQSSIFTPLVILVGQLLTYTSTHYEILKASLVNIKFIYLARVTNNVNP